MMFTLVHPFSSVKSGSFYRFCFTILGFNFIFSSFYTAAQAGHARGKTYYTVEKTLFEVDTRYVPDGEIGKGVFGVVCSALNNETNERVAIKKIRNALDHPIHPLQALREMALLRNTKHPNVIALKDVMLPVDELTFKDVYLVYELMDTNLDSMIYWEQKLSSNNVRHLFFQFLQGLEYLHSANIIHRDLKPDNLFVNNRDDLVLKIGDFGMSTTIKGNKEDFLENYLMHRWFRAPELLVGCNNYGSPIDVWSAGCIFAQLLGWEGPIFTGKDTKDQLRRIIDVLGTPSDDDLELVCSPTVRKYISKLPYSRGTSFSSMYHDADELAIDLLKKLLVFDPKLRYTVTQALQHPYFSGVYKYDPDRNPLAEKPLDLNLDEGMTIPMIREAMWLEMRRYHPEPEFGVWTNLLKKVVNFVKYVLIRLGIFCVFSSIYLYIIIFKI